MNKKEYLILYLLALVVLSICFIFQRVPGYMDSEYYYLGGKALASGKTSLPVVWNYLDQPEILPHPLFTYWMPLASIMTSVSIILFGSSKFFFSRLLFWLIAAAIAPLSAYISYQISKKKFSAWITALLAIFSGYYFKFFTINETITLYIILGGFFLIIFSKLFEKAKKTSSTTLCFMGGLTTGLVHLARVDGFIIFLFGICVICAYIYRKFKSENGFSKQWILYLILYVTGYLLITGWWYARNFELFGNLFSPASSRALWITTYDDTFIYPASILNYKYWINNGLPLKLEQIWDALKSNISSMIAVQSLIFGFPLLVAGYIKKRKNSIIIIALTVWSLFFLLMTFVFSLAGGRGGFLHSEAFVQIIFWCLIAEGLTIFIQWGIKKRGWKLLRSQIMFGTALILFSIFFTFSLYYQDVIGDSSETYIWESENIKYKEIEEVIKLSADSITDVIMINNPVGYYYETNRWSIVIPNSNIERFPELVKQFDVKYVVLDENLPEKLKNPQNLEEKLNLKLLKKFEDGRKIYAVE